MKTGSQKTHKTFCTEKIYFCFVNKQIERVEQKNKELLKMSLDKLIKKGWEHRKPYKGSKSIDSTCRNHGSCVWCRDNRTYKNNKREREALEKEREFRRRVEEKENE